MLLRRRSGVSRRAFAKFIHERVGPALNDAGVLGLRTYVFLPSAVSLHPTPGVAHDNPPFRRYHAAVIFGLPTRADLDDLLNSPHIRQIVSEQSTTCTAVHAYTIERTVPVIHRGSRVHA
jgi:hypothetical protein